MGKLKILLVEDIASDVEFIKYEIKRGGISFIAKDVATKVDFISALHSFAPDVILSDYSMPRFTGMDALLLRNQTAPSIPFILVTGSTNEEIAVACMKSGADDYLVKGNLFRLGSAIRSAIERRNILYEKLRAEEALQRKLIVLTNPLEDTADVKFEDLFDLKEIQRIQDALSAAWGVASLITDAQGKPITKPSNFCRLCENIVRKTKKGLANCFQSDSALGRLNPDGPIMQPCMSGGLWDGGTSIRVGERHIANWLIGQVLDESTNRQTLLAYGSEIGANPEEFAEALNEVPSMSREQFAKICDALFLVAEQFSRLALQNIQQARNISERKVLEKRFQNAQRLANIGHWEFDLRTRTVWASEEAFSIYGVEHSSVELPFELFQEQVIPEHRPLMAEAMQRLVADGADYNQEFSIRRLNDGEIRCLHSRAELLFNSHKVPVKVAGVIQDITERKIVAKELIEAKEKAEEMNRLKSSFLANMSHELRTPMMGILGYSEILNEEAVDPQIKSLADVIHNSGSRLLETLNLILDLSRIEAGKLEVNFAKLDIVPIVKDVCEQFISDARKKGLSFEVTASDEHINLFLDERMFREIINNLVNNAIKYTMFGGIAIQTAIENISGTVCATIKVRDTGLGITAENLNIIFDEFRQVSEGLGRRFEGTGLGLTITKKFTERMNGTLTVESEFEVGTTFTVSFPLPEAENYGNDSDKGSKTGSGFKDKLQADSQDLPVVLYVEDDPIASNLVEIMLARVCRIEFAETSPEAMQKVQSKQYAAILMDINLGKGTDGVQTTKMIRQMDNYKKTPVIAITAFAMIGDREEFLASGCTDYISKPFEKHELIELMTNVLQR